MICRRLHALLQESLILQRRLLRFLCCGHEDLLAGTRRQQGALLALQDRTFDLPLHVKPLARLAANLLKPFKLAVYGKAQPSYLGGLLVFFSHHVLASVGGISVDACEHGTHQRIIVIHLQRLEIRLLFRLQLALYPEEDELRKVAGSEHLGADTISPASTTILPDDVR